MKKLFPIVSILLLLACNSNNRSGDIKEDDTLSTNSRINTANKAENKDTIEAKVYSNDRFRNVSVTRTSDNSFKITGEARVFEAAFSWVVEDGHNELMTGHEMTDAGAPAWGKFNFVVHAEKVNENSTLHLILFEASPKDGSRQSELPILLF